MTNKTELTPKSEKNLSLEKYGLGPLSWDRAREQIETFWKDQEPGSDTYPHTHWLSTVRPDGRPHVMPVGIAYHDGAFYLVSGLGTRKSKNLAANPNCVVSFAARGIDIVVECEAKIVTDDAKLHQLAEVYSGWGPKVENGAFVHDYSAPAAGPPPWYVYELTPKTVFATATADPHGATKWEL
jgi:hypothetical protein